MAYLDLLILQSFKEVNESSTYNEWANTARYHKQDPNFLRQKNVGEADSNDFDDDEYLLAVLLGLLFAVKGAEAKEDVLDVLDDPAVTVGTLIDTIDRHKGSMSQVITEDTVLNINAANLQRIIDESNLDVSAIDVLTIGKTINPRESIDRLLNRVIDKGADVTNAIEQVRGAVYRDNLVARMKESIDTFTNSYYEKYLQDDIVNSFQRALSNRSATELDLLDDFTTVKETVEKRFSNNPYWRTVSNAHVSRSYHYGVLKGGSQNGFSAYRYNAILDEKTSDICLELHNRVFQIRDGLDFVEKAMRAVGDEIKSVAPYGSVEEVLSLSEAELRDKGYIVPPQHFNCRSSITLIRSSLG